jgi:hypothetical protein
MLATGKRMATFIIGGQSVGSGQLAERTEEGSGQWAVGREPRRDFPFLIFHFSFSIDDTQLSELANEK